MKKVLSVLVLAGSVLPLSFGPALHATQEPGGNQPAVQEAVPEQQTTRLLNRGDVLMPNDPLLVKMAALQERSQRQYKSMTFEQKSVIERYKPRTRLQENDSVSSRREIVARYSPDGNGELKPSLISDSDPKASEKARKKRGKGENAGERKRSLAEELISPILFPMTTENVKKCKFTVELALPDMMLLRFEPEAMNTDPIFTGQVFVNPETGEIYRLEIDALYNFEKIDGRFKYLKEFKVRIDYTSQSGGYHFPTYMRGQGFAKVLWIKGNFRFDIVESGYRLASVAEVAQ